MRQIEYEKMLMVVVKEYGRPFAQKKTPEQIQAIYLRLKRAGKL